MIDTATNNNDISSAVRAKQLPSLNGLRGISIILVVAFHLHLANNNFLNTILNGHLGVNIFFVLSGFLITTLCIKEKEVTGSINLKSFYIRRILRIFPVAYLYLIVLCVLNFVFHLQIAGLQFLGSVLYVMNFSFFRSHNFSWFMGHYWSLSVEEQFYIIFPFILKTKPKVFFYALLFIIVVLPLLCAVQAFLPQLNNGVLYAFTHYFIKFQAISVGCLFSVLAMNRSFDLEWLNSFKMIGNLIALFLIFYIGYDDFFSVKAIFLNLIISLLTGYIILSNIAPQKDFIFKTLNNKLLSQVGILSYSIYIWQQIFTSDEQKLPSFLVNKPFNIVLIVLVPVLSYYCYEKYFLSLKSKFSVIKK